MEVERKLKPLRIGKGLLCLLALFVMLLAPQVAWAEDYVLSVAGHQYMAADLQSTVTVTGDNISGTVTITPASDSDPVKLTLNSASITGKVVSNIDLKVDFIGSNAINIQSDEYAFEGDNSNIISFMNSGKNGKPLSVIGSFNANITSNWSSVATSIEISETPTSTAVWWLNTNTGTSNLMELMWYGISYGLTVAGVDVKESNASHILGENNTTVTFDASSNTLTLNNASFEGTVNWSNSSNLTIEILGDANEIDARHNPVFVGNSNAELTLTTSTTPGSLLITSIYTSEILSGWKNSSSIIYYDENNSTGDAADYGWWADGYSEEWRLRVNKKYDLWVNGIQFCSAQNRFDNYELSESYISFDGDKTLTFENYRINTDKSPFIQNGLNNLNIKLIGENSVGCGQLFLAKKDGDSDHDITLKADEEEGGTLVVTTTGGENDPWYSGHNTPTIKGLVFADEMSNNVRTLTFSEPTPYDLTVAGVTVTNANATAITGDNITGTVTYNDETHTLTLDNVTIDLTDEENEGPGIKYSGTANLIIVLNGTNSIKVQSGCEPIIYDAEEVPPTVPTLTFERGSHPCSLELQGVNSPVIKYFANVLGVNGINDVTGNFLKLDTDAAVAYSQTNGLHTVQDSETSPVTSAKIVSFLLDPKFYFSTSENSAISNGGTEHYTYGEENTLPVLKRWDDDESAYVTDLSGFSITYTSSDENVATISNTGVITIVGGGWAEIRASIAATDMYEADETWFNVEVRPADPYVSISEGAYFTGQKLTLTRVGLSGSMYYSYDYKETSERTAYTGEISLPAGVYDFYPYTRCGTDEQNIWSYGNAHRMLYVYDQPTISKDAGEYEGDIEVEITNLPEGGSYSATVYYYFDDDEENAKVYNAGDKIAVRESTKLNVYLLVEGDSGKTPKTQVIERQYVIKDIPLALTDDDFHNHWATYYNNNGNVALPENKNIGVYIASGISGQSVTVTQIKSIPRGVPVFLNNETTSTTDNTSTTGNMLQHANEDIAVSEGNVIYYGLYNGMMKRVHGTISAGKNYLPISVATQPAGAPELTIVIDGETTGISEIERMRNVDNENVYDLQGRKVQKPSKEGIYIQNGRKVVINQKRK